MPIYAHPGSEGALIEPQSRYDHWINNEFVPRVKGQYFENPSPVTGQV